MNITNFEFKASVDNIDELEQKLLKLNPHFVGEDRQIDTYFIVPEGRLKLREGNIENALIYYQREDIAGSKKSDVILYKHTPDRSLKKLLAKIHGIKTIVDKTRRIYFIENVKFHFDRVKDLGVFLEVEAIDESGRIGIKKVKKQCDEFLAFFGIEKQMCVDKSYSDLILEKKIGGDE